MSIELLVAKVQATRDAAHQKHWAVTGQASYAQHMALDGLYSDLPGLIDEIVECLQGVTGKRIGEIPSVNRPKLDMIITHLASELEWIEANRGKIAQGHAFIENQIDELSALYAKALYKLRFLG